MMKKCSPDSGCHPVHVKGGDWYCSVHGQWYRDVDGLGLIKVARRASTPARS